MIYIDTGAFIAKYIERDQYHQKSLKVWQQLERSKAKLFTSNFVLDEVLTLLLRRTYADFATEKADLLYQSDVLKILRPTLETEITAIRHFKKFSDQQISFTDCVSFQLMKEHKIKKVFTYDQHFELLGFSSIN
ncbi:MAG: PIN domain-containing protein [Gammaproteobacteria bacterium]|nr:PIN domain-containing protein [Gammaproteobacteria bacterium]MCH9743545.1 PIN domain-containing protein [Gammaproteobacteria bacterium]